MTPPVLEVVGAVYDRAFSGRTEDVFHKGMPGPQRWLFTDYPIYYITACAHHRIDRTCKTRSFNFACVVVRSAEDWPYAGEIARLALVKRRNARS